MTISNEIRSLEVRHGAHVKACCVCVVKMGVVARCDDDADCHKSVERAVQAASR